MDILVDRHKESVTLPNNNVNDAFRVISMFTTLSISDIEIIVFRDDLNHKTVSGNKLHKLSPNIDIAKARHCSKVLSFGGPYSNHLHALAWACNDAGLDSVGVVRGELAASLTSTLVDCQQWGMQLIPLSRKVYREYQEELSHLSDPCLASELNLVDLISSLDNQHSTLVLPEGGSNLAAINSVSRIYRGVFDAAETLGATHAVCATGTGATLAGLYQACPVNVKVIGMQAVAEQTATIKRIQNWLGKGIDDLAIIESHLGRFGKITPSLVDFIDAFEREHNIPLDPIYTGKAMYQLVKMIDEGYFNKQDKIVFIHTGGLQGRRN